MIRVVIVGLIVMLGQALALTVQAKPKLLVSIKPLALIAKEVAGDRAQVDTLLPITASPHDYPLKMSDHRRLRSADLVIWVGPELESFLARSLANIPAQKQLATYTLPNLFWPNLQTGDSHEHATHQHAGRDPHLWLDPRNAAVIARAMAQKLALLDPSETHTYQANAMRFINEVEYLDQQISKQLAPVMSRGFAVYHEGYSHFVGRYGLHQVGYVTYRPELRPGAMHLRELQDVLKKEGRCLFVEPYYKAGSTEVMVQSLGLKIGTLDPIGGQQVSSYKVLLENLASSFLTCLADVTD